MEKFIEELMLIANGCIINRKQMDWGALNLKITNSTIDEGIKNQLRLLQTDNLRKYNTALFDLKETLLEEEDEEKKMSRLISPLPRETLEAYYHQFKNYPFNMIHTPYFKTKENCKKVYLGHLENIWGSDPRCNKEELEQEGRMYLWESLRKFGKRPETRKDFKERNRKMDENGISSASTFAYGAVFCKFINLGKKCLGQKYTGVDAEGKKLYGSAHVEYDEDLYAQPNEERFEFDLDIDEVKDKKTWTKLCNELNLPQESTSIFTRAGELHSTISVDNKRK